MGKDGTKTIDRKLDKRTLSKIEKNLGIPWNKERILDRMTSNFLSVANTYVEQGMLALFLKSEVSHGEFLKIIDETFVGSGICSSRTIRKCMQIARFVLDNPKLAETSNFISLGVSKQLMLAGASDDEMDEADGGLSIFGMTLEDFRARRICDIEKERDQYKRKCDKLEATNRKGRDQLADAQEKIEELHDLRKLAGKSNKDIQKILEIQFNSIHGALEMTVGELCNGGAGSAGDLAKNQIALVNGFMKSVRTLVDETTDAWAEAIRKS